MRHRSPSVRTDELRGEVPASATCRSPPAPLLVARPDEVEPLTGELCRFHTTVSQRFLAKLAAARDGLSHRHSGGGTGGCGGGQAPALRGGCPPPPTLV